MAITLYKADGAEHGSVAGGASGVHDVAPFGTPTITTTNQRSGSRAFQLNPAGAAEGIRYGPNAGPVGVVTTFAVYIKFTTLPTTAGDPIIRVRRTTGTENGFLEWDQTNTKFRADAGAGSPVVGGPTIATGQWYKIIIEYDCTTTTAVFRACVDGTEWQATGTIAAGGVANIDVTIGSAGAATYDLYYDDVVMSVTDGDYEQIKAWDNWEILSAIPTSDGTHNITTLGDFDSFATTAFDNSTTNGHTFIGHRPISLSQGSNVQIRQDLGTTSNYMEFLFENPANTHPNVAGVQTYGAFYESATSGAGLGEMRLLLSDNTEVLTTGSLSVKESTEDPGITLTVTKRAAIAPSGGWDETKVDGLKCRVGFGDNAPDSHFTDFFLEVVYYSTPAAAVHPPLPTIVSDAGHRSHSW